MDLPRKRRQLRLRRRSEHGCKDQDLEQFPRHLVGGRDRRSETHQPDHQHSLRRRANNLKHAQGIPDPDRRQQRHHRRRRAENVSYEYQWHRADGETDEAIAGATSSTYTLVKADDTDMPVYVVVSFEDDAGYPETASSTRYPSDGSVLVPCEPDELWCGTLEVQTVATEVFGCSNDTSDLCSSTSILNYDDIEFTLDGKTYTFQHIKYDAGTDFLSVEFTTDLPVHALAWTLHAGDSSFAFTNTDTSTRKSKTWDEAGLDWSDGDNVDFKITTANILAEGQPTISGTPIVGETLTVDISGINDADGLHNVSYSYQWYRSDRTTRDAITGATSSTYTLG